MTDGTASQTSNIGYAQYTIAADQDKSGNTFKTDFVGGYSRIHTTETILPGTAIPCQLVDMTDQIGCLSQADPCSIGYAGDASHDWNERSPINTPQGGLTGGGAAPAVGMGPLRVAQIAPATTTVQELGTPGEYQLSRKLYFNSFVGFNQVASAASANGSNTAAAELYLANWEATDTNINSLLPSYGFFTLGSQTPSGLGTSGLGAPFCEDFNEDNLCGLGTGAANVNACTSIHTTITEIANTANTVCGNGTVEAYEECDDGATNGATGDKCSTTCRCTTQYIATSPVGPSGGSTGCQ